MTRWRKLSAAGQSGHARFSPTNSLICQVWVTNGQSGGACAARLPALYVVGVCLNRIGTVTSLVSPARPAKTSKQWPRLRIIGRSPVRPLRYEHFVQRFPESLRQHDHFLDRDILQRKLNLRDIGLSSSCGFPKLALGSDLFLNGTAANCGRRPAARLCCLQRGPPGAARVLAVALSSIMFSMILPISAAVSVWTASPSNTAVRHAFTGSLVPPSQPHTFRNRLWA